MGWGNHWSKKSKFNAKKTVYRGVEFDSTTERDRYLHLCYQIHTGEITDLRRQVRFEIIPQISKLVPKQLKTKVRYDKRVVESAAHYTADFVYVENGKFIIEDVKSEATQDVRDFSLRRKLMVQKIYEHNAKGRSQWMFREVIKMKDKSIKIINR